MIDSSRARTRTGGQLRERGHGVSTGYVESMFLSRSNDCLLRKAERHGNRKRGYQNERTASRERDAGKLRWKVKAASQREQTTVQILRYG
jgi:hypothetical protein